MTKRCKRPEAAIQRGVLQILDMVGAKGLFYFHVPGNPRSAIAGRNLKLLGAVAGVPDLWIVKNGYSFCLELKSERGRLSPAQSGCHAALRAAGVTVGICNSIESAVSWLKEKGLLRAEVT